MSVEMSSSSIKCAYTYMQNILFTARSPYYDVLCHLHCMKPSTSHSVLVAADDVHANVRYVRGQVEVATVDTQRHMLSAMSSTCPPKPCDSHDRTVCRTIQYMYMNFGDSLHCPRTNFGFETGQYRFLHVIYSY